MMFIWYILIGIAAGFIAGKIVRGGGLGLFLNLIVGIIGGVLGIWTTGVIGSLITATVGAIVLLAIVSLFSNKKA